MGYYDNLDRIMIGVDITTLTDVFEENYREDNGVDFDWNKDGDRFNEASRELDILIENVFVKMFGNAIAESYDDDTYILTFWGDRDNPNDIKTLQELQGRADDTWRDNDRVQLAIYDTEFYTGNQSGKFADKWGDIGNALVDAITVGIDFPEEFDSDPMYEKVNGMSIKNSKQIKSSAKSGEVDPVAADELAFCTVNDGDLYRQMTTSIITNLKKKIKDGTYNKELALKAWLNLVTVEARKYVKEFGSLGDTIDKMFNLNTRNAAAKQVAKHYEDALI